MLVLFGGGAFAVEIASYLRDIAADGARSEGCIVTDIVDPAPSRLDDLTRILGSKPNVVSSYDKVPGLSTKRGIICVGDPAVRWKIQREIGTLCSWQSVVHPLAHIARYAVISEGAIIPPFAFVGPFAHVGSNAALNVGAAVGHDAVVGSCAVMSPHSAINGFASLGIASFMGANATVVPKVSLGAFSKLSAGGVLRTSIGNGFLLEGNPAQGRQMFRVPLDVPQE